MQMSLVSYSHAFRGARLFHISDNKAYNLSCNMYDRHTSFLPAAYTIMIIVTSMTQSGQQIRLITRLINFIIYHKQQQYDIAMSP